MQRKTIIKRMRSAVASVMAVSMMAAPVLVQAEEALPVEAVEAEAAAEPEELDQTLEAGVKVTSIEISGSASMAIGAPRQFTANVLPENAENKEVLWKSGNEKVATVDQDGIVTPKNNGTVKIYAYAKDGSDVKGEFDVTVGAVKVTSILVFGDDSPMLQGGAARQLTVEIEPSFATDQSVSWRSSSSSVATVDATGKVTPVGPGYADIYALAKDGSGVEGKFTVKVNPKSMKVKSVTLVNEKDREVKVEWTAVNAGSGYILQWSKDEDFDEDYKKVYSHKITKPSTKSYNIKLKKKGKWYFRICYYKTVKNPVTGVNEDLVGEWGKVKSFKAKK